jgi:CBS domain-containing protein
MRGRHVGALVIVEPGGKRPRPVGIVTDRDLVVSVIAPSIDPRVFTLGDVANQELVMVDQDEDVFTTVHRMRVKGVRRVPVVDALGELVGIFTLDDFLALLAREMREVANLIAREQEQEQVVRLPLSDPFPSRVAGAS